MRKIKVMHLLNRLDTGGLENGVINLSNNFDRGLIEPVICCMHGLGAMRDRLRPDVKVVELRCLSGFRLSSFVALKRCLKELRPDILHAHGWGQGSLYGVLAGRWAGVPVIINGEHGGFFFKGRQIMAQRLLSNMCDVICSVSTALKQEIERNLGIRASKIVVIKNGVDMEVFNGKYDSSYLLKEIRGITGVTIEPSDFIIALVASLKTVKNQKMIIEAIELINRQNDSGKCRVLLVGKGPDRDMLEKMVQDKGLQAQVIFMGERHDIPAILSLAHMLVLTSISEGMSNVLLEAMSSGRPVVSTRSEGSDEVIRDGENGYVIGTNDSMAMAEKIVMLSRDRELYEKMSRGARDFILRHYSISTMVREYEQMYTHSLQKQ